MQRQQDILTWLAGIWPASRFALAPASSDASFRRYFRVTRDDNITLIVMDAPPEHVGVRRWLAVQKLLHEAGVHVPQVLEQDLAQGFLLLSDLGGTTYLQQLTIETAPSLYGDAFTALLALQHIARPADLPDYDSVLLRRELELFPEWFLGTHHQLTLSDSERAGLTSVFDRIIERNLAEPRVFVHRDFHSRNLMRVHSESLLNPGVIDFQDAVWGPVSYDAVSLLKDAYILWDEERALDWLIRYWERARAAGIPVRADFSEFYADYEWMGMQRHLKILGIFARLHHRDGKEGYLKELPRVSHYVRKVGERYAALRPLLRLLDRVEARQPAVGYTF